MKQPVFLIGFMASGKTTFGRALARALGREFIDLDFYITQRFRATVPQIFAERGEEGFRRIERDMLREVGEFNDVVIACGGGTPCFFDNMDYINSRGTSVLLEASPERTRERLLLRPGTRPLADSRSPEELLDYIRETTAARAPFYGRAKIRLSSDRLEDKKQISASVRAFISEFPEI